MIDFLKADNKDIILKAQEGDMFAFRALVDEYKEQIVRIAYSITGNLADAQDVAQDALIRVHKNIKKFNFDAKFSTWLYRIVVNLGYDFLRKRGRLKDSTGTGSAQFLDDSHEDRKATDAVKTLLNEELRGKIEEALKCLSRKQQMVFILKYKQDMKIKEIARVMGISESSVKVHLFRAIDKMQKKLSGYVR